MTPKAKIAISIDQGVLDEVHRAVGDGGAASVSAFVEHALRSQLVAGVEFLRLVDAALDEAGGPMTPDEVAWAEEALGLER